MLVSFDWLTEYLGDTDLTPQQMADLLGYHAFEIEGIEAAESDTVIDVDVLPNRSSDCLSHRGIARELASITGTALAHDPLKVAPELPTTELISVDIQNTEACPRFTASLITGVEIKASPDWLQARLKAIGQRPINNIVDATNYVMFALGQPLHAYDADLFPQVDGAWQFMVRSATEGETVSLLPEGESTEDRVVELTGAETLVVDGSNNTPIGLAGVKGGRFAGVHAGTTKVIIEAASWHPTITRVTARRLGIVTDAGKRFENEVTREMALYAQAEIVALILKIAGGTHEGTVDVYPEPVTQSSTTLTIGQANSLLGLDLTGERMVELLQAAGCEAVLDGETVTATGPWERTDLNIAEDYIEEIGRLNGYDHVAAVVPETVPLAELNARQYYGEAIRQCLLGHGFSEVITSSFRKKDKVQLKNALASDKSYLRSTLTKNITEVLDRNAGFVDLLGAADTRVFEIGTVFYPADGSVAEHISLCVGVRLKQSGYSGKEDKLLKEITDTIESAIGTPIDWTIEKGVAECNLTALLEQLPAPTAYEPVVVADEIVYQPFSTFQHMSRDIAMWMTEDATPAAVEAVLNEAAGELCVRTTLVDEFEKDGRISLAFRLVFQSNEKTLTDSEINQVMDQVNHAVAERGWEVR